MRRRRMRRSEKLYQCATYHFFLSLHSAPGELTGVGPVPFTKNLLVEKIKRKAHVFLTPQCWFYSISNSSSVFTKMSAVHF